MPTRDYCEGYFEIQNLFNCATYKSDLSKWILYLIFEIKPNCIISISQYCNELIDELYKENISFDRISKIKHLQIKSPKNIQFSELYDISVKIGQNDKTIFFTDVIGTTNSITNILRHFIHIENQSIYSIVNATEGNRPYIYNGNEEIAINHLAQKELKFYYNRPESWDEGILMYVDPRTNSLIKERVPKVISLWQKYKESSFLESIINKNKYYLKGHFSHDDTHLTYLFDIPSIIKNHGEEIASLILEDLKVKKIESTNGKILYLNDKLSLHSIGALIAKEIYFQLETINNSDIVLIDDFTSNEYYGNIVIAIDDAFDTGGNVHRLIDFCARKKAKELIIYVIIKRGSNYSARKIYNINKYDNINVSFKYVAEIEIPTYNSGNCPICKKIDELKQVNEKIKNSNLDFLEIYISNQIFKLSINKIEDITDRNNFFIKSDNEYLQYEISTREILQKSIYDNDYRHRLVSLIKTYAINKDKVLIIFKIISNEKLFILLDKKFEADIYENEFKEAIIKACLFYMQKLAELSSEEFDSILSILIHINTNTFIDNFHNLCFNSIANTEKFLTLVKHLYLSDIAIIFSQRIMSTFSHLKNEISDENLWTLIGNLQRHWESFYTPNLDKPEPNRKNA